VAKYYARTCNENCSLVFAWNTEGDDVGRDYYLWGYISTGYEDSVKRDPGGHIEARHKELRGQLDKMKLTLVEPDAVYHSVLEETYHYYKKFSSTPISEKFLLLVAKHEDGEGFIITAFFVATVRTREKVLVYGSKNRNLI